MSKKRNIVFVAGASGGHIMPAVVMAQREELSNSNLTCSFIATDSDIDRTVLARIKNQNLVHYYPMCGVNGGYILVFWRLFWAYVSSYRYLKKLRPERVVATGGLLCVPVLLAARHLGISIDLYEFNTVPGRAVRMVAPWANRIFVTFEKAIDALCDKDASCAQRCQVVEYPHRFTARDLNMTKVEAIGKLTIFVMGGSKGAIWINNAMEKLIKAQPQWIQSVQIIHQVGEDDVQKWQRFYQDHAIPATVFAFTHDIANLYHAADRVISRAGAGSIFELAFFGKKTLLIPLEGFADDHQVGNAHAIARTHKNLFSVYLQSSAERDFSAFEEFVSHFLAYDLSVRPELSRMGIERI